MNSLKDTFELNNGVKIPCIGYGTYQTPDDIAEDVCTKAIEAGYVHIDTAALYGNEVGVGKGIKKSGIKREELFVTTKVWNTERGYKKATASFDDSMKRLGLDYLDLLLIHWPANKKQFGDAAKDLNADTWRAFEDLYKAGKVRAIGLSNFLPHHIDDLLETATVTPMVNQIEFHPGWAQLEVSDYCHKKRIVVEAWSPLGRKDALSDPVITAIAKKYGKDAAQVCVRWVLQHGILPLPKSVTPVRIISNTKVFDFELSAEDMAALDAIKTKYGQCADPDQVDF